GDLLCGHRAPDGIQPFPAHIQPNSGERSVPRVSVRRLVFAVPRRIRSMLPNFPDVKLPNQLMLGEVTPIYTRLLQSAGLDQCLYETDRPIPCEIVRCRRRYPRTDLPFGAALIQSDESGLWSCGAN